MIQRSFTLLEVMSIMLINTSYIFINSFFGSVTDPLPSPPRPHAPFLLISASSVQWSCWKVVMDSCWMTWFGAVCLTCTFYITWFLLIRKWIWLGARDVRADFYELLKYSTLIFSHSSPALWGESVCRLKDSGRVCGWGMWAWPFHPMAVSS